MASSTSFSKKSIHFYFGLRGGDSDMSGGFDRSGININVKSDSPRIHEGIFIKFVPIVINEFKKLRSCLVTHYLIENLTVLISSSMLGSSVIPVTRASAAAELCRLFGPLRLKSAVPV